MAALSLLERNDGPIILEDFPYDPPGWKDTPGWQPPFRLPVPVLPAQGDVLAWSAKLSEEMMLVQPHYSRWVANNGRTTVGISRQMPAAWPDYAATFLGGALPFPPPGLPTAAIALRFLCDDIKAWYA